MPRVFGTSVLGIFLASLAFFVVGFLWYGVFFMKEWAVLTGTPTDGDMSITPLIVGFMITLVQVLGLSFILQHAGASTLVTCVKICGLIALLIAFPIMAYNLNYEGRPLALFKIDGSHILVGYLLVGVVLSFFRGKDANKNH